MRDNNSTLARAKGFPFDKHRCFFIKDFKPGDSITVKTGRDSQERGVVEKIDMKTLEVIYKTSSSSGKKAFTSEIISLGRHRPDWIDSND